MFDSTKAKEDLISRLSTTTNLIHVNHDNYIFNKIIISINDYLKNNKSVSDFHLLKDIVDRNCDSIEEEINTQIPIPLYMGLVGTMAGILVGILYLWLSGGIGDLLNAGINSGAEGVEALLGGVALAMISSILGIILTTIGSEKFKTTKVVVENCKHIFLSWIQAKLLPTLSDNVVGAIREMTCNLSEFNDIFSKNTRNLDNTLSKVNESYRLQSQLLELVQNIADKDLTHQNLLLYNELRKSTQEIGVFAEFLQNSNLYLTNVKSLNEKLDLQENRTRAIEDVGIFFKKEIENIEQREYAMANNVTKVNDYLQRALENLSTNTQSQIDKINIIFTKQQDILKCKSEEIESIVTELKQLSAIKESISKFEQAILTQNGKLDNLIKSIERFAQINVSTKVNNQTFYIPNWVKISSITGFSILVLSSIIIAGKTLISSDGPYTKDEISIMNDSVVKPPFKDSLNSTVVDSVMTNN
jgi:hypothetical protein